MKALVLSGCAVMFFFSGCASSPSFGDRVLQEGESKIAIAEQWEEGKRLVKDGEKKVRKGRRLVEKGRADIRKGEQMVASGNVAVRNNRQAYQGLSQTEASDTSAEAASERAAKLKKYARGWEQGEEEIADGRKLIKRGQARIAEGEEQIEAGEALLERGRDKMQAAERKYQKAQ